MQNLSPKTKKNLEDAFAGESMARNKYTFFASVARKAGFEQIADLFLETADNEKEHAKLWAKELGLIRETADNLQAGIDGEHYENSEMYVRMAREAEEEGYSDIARKFLMVAEAEKAHEARYRKLLKNLKEDKVFRREEKVGWKCGNCGYIHTGEAAPDVCPVCQHKQAFFELFAETY